jgi:hypothetical protein
MKIAMSIWLKNDFAVGAKTPGGASSSAASMRSLMSALLRIKGYQPIFAHSAAVCKRARKT